MIRCMSKPVALTLSRPGTKMYHHLCQVQRFAVLYFQQCLKYSIHTFITLLAVLPCPITSPEFESLAIIPLDSGE